MIYHISNKKEGNIYDYLNRCRKRFNSVQHPVVLKKKTLNKGGLDETHLSIIKDICEKPRADINSMMEKLELFL